MRPTFKKSLALLGGTVGLLLLLVGWRVGSVAYLALGIASLVALSILVNLVVYRHVVGLLDRIAQLDKRVGATVSMAQQSARANKRQVEVSGKLEASQHRVQHDLAAFSSRLDDMAKRLDASEAALRVAARQSGDAIDITLRVFQEAGVRHEEISRRTTQLAGRMDDLYSGFNNSLEAMPNQVGAVVSSAMGGLTPFVEVTGKQLRQLIRTQQAQQDGLAPFVEVTGKQLRQLIRTQQAQQEGFAPFVEVTGKQLRQLIRTLQAHQDGLVPFVDLTGKQLSQLIRDVDSVGSSLGPLGEASELHLRRITEEITSGKSAVAEFLRNDKKLKNLTKRAMYETVQEVEALSQLEQLFTGALPRPLLGGFAMTPTAMLALFGEIQKNKPALVVELGSGTSTLWIAQALKLNGVGRLVSIEHLEEFHAKTLAALRNSGLEEWVDLRLAPLEEVDINGETFNWYASSSIQGLKNIDIFIVDGPPGFTGPLARYPALPLLVGSLAERSLVIVDDADREDELATVKRWKEEIEGLGESRAVSPRTQILPYQS